jgi:glycerol-3-phosphate acyltransferase PlsY
MPCGGAALGRHSAARDGLKGILAILVTRWIMDGNPNLIWAEVLTGLAAVIGHNASIYLGFKGGAGTGPNVGVCIALWPLSALWLIPLVPFGFAVIGYASVTSLLIAAVIPVSMAIRAALGLGPWQHLIYAVGARQRRAPPASTVDQRHRTAHLLILTHPMGESYADASWYACARIRHIL